MSLISLLWRAVNGPLFETGNAQEYSREQRRTIRDALAAIRRKALDWRLEIFERNLDPYLSGGRVTPLTPGTPTKGGGSSYRHDARYFLLRDINEERWGVSANPESREAAEAYVRDHRYAEQMDIDFTILRPARTGVPSTQGGFLDPNTALNATGTNTMAPFDVLVLGGGIALSFEIKGDIKPSPPQIIDRDERSLLDDSPGRQDVSTTVSVSLAGETQYTYTELLNAVYEQNRSKLLAIAYDWLSANTLGSGIRMSR